MWILMYDKPFIVYYLQNFQDQAPLITELAEKNVEYEKNELLDESDIAAYRLVNTYAVKSMVERVEANKYVRCVDSLLTRDPLYTCQITSHHDGFDLEKIKLK